MTSDPVRALGAGVRGVLRAIVRTWPRRVVLAVVVLVPVLVAALGGLRTVDLPPPPQVAVGEPFDLGPAQVQVEAFFVSEQVFTSMLPDGARGWVGVLVELTAHTQDEWSLPDDVFALPGLTGTGQLGHAVITQDDSLLVALGPDVPQRVALLFPVPEVTAVPEDLELTMRSLYEQRSFFDQTMRWYTDEVAATVRVPRTDEIPPALIDEA